MKIGNVNSNINFNGFVRFQNQDKTEKSDVINTALILGAQSRYGKTDAFKPNEYQANKVNFINKEGRIDSFMSVRRGEDNFVKNLEAKIAEECAKADKTGKIINIKI